MSIQQLGSILLKHKVISKDELELCLDMQRNMKTDEKIGQILKRCNFVSDEAVAKALAEQVGWKYFDKKYIIHLPMAEKIGLDFLTERVFIPVETDKGPAFIFAHPFDTQTTDVLADKESRDKELYIGSEAVIRYHLGRLNNRNKKIEINKCINQIKLEGVKGDELKELADNLLDDAVSQGATDIHIEPEEKVSAIRFRIDGVLYFKFCLPIEAHNNLINVIFNKADITVSDFFKFHDARFEHKCLNHSVDIRVSCIPSIAGPAIVLRLLDVNKTLISMDKLGFHKTHFEAIQNAGIRPHGIIIITGPTGSGKTTTLYAILNRSKSVSNKIITIEDPVEIKMPLINQVQINEKQGVTFAQAARAFLRHDPDIILIGEIRDSDTAKQAIRASLTGHKVLSTLHTNSALDCVYRLNDLGVELTHIANSVLCVVSQRLVRKLCVSCSKKAIVKKEALPDFMKRNLAEDVDKITVYKPVGCLGCQDGYRGRTVIAEVLLFDQDVRDMVSRGNLEQLRQKNKTQGYISLQDDAARLVREGVTSIEEALRVAG